ncbi:MAG TPA: Clp protease N-terminal domain-containing protein [Capsulimonadaceae bacterium]|jgi:hypothetical protein
MWTKLTARTQRALFYAQQEAEWRGDMQVTPDDILLGVIRNPTSAAQDVLTGLGVSGDDIRRQVKSRRPSAVMAGKQLTLSIESLKVIDAAYGEQRRLRSRDVTTQHLLLALLAIKPTVASDVLSALGMTLEAAHSVTPTYIEHRNLEDDDVNDRVWPPAIKPMPADFEEEASAALAPDNGPWYLQPIGFVAGVAVGYYVPIFYLIAACVVVAIITRNNPRHNQFLAALVFGSLIGGLLPGSWLSVHPIR